LTAAALLPLNFAHAHPADDSLRIYAVNIIQDPPQSWTGYGIYLGRGLVITAAHVVGSAAHTKPSVRIADMDLPASAIKEGDFETGHRRGSRRHGALPCYVAVVTSR
jgi:hypothetical protein